MAPCTEMESDNNPATEYNMEWRWSDVDREVKKDSRLGVGLGRMNRRKMTEKNHLGA
jgi:hypothetical protein